MSEVSVLAAERERQDQLVVSALSAVGEDCASVYDYVNGKSLRNKQSIDVLLGMLPIITEDRIKEGIVRTLKTSWARGKAEKILIKEFRGLPDTPSANSVRWAIGLTLGSLDLNSVSSDALDIAADARYGTARQEIVLALNKVADERAIPLLINLLKEEGVRGHAIMALRKAKARSAARFIEADTTDKKPWIRRTAKTALAALRR